MLRVEGGPCELERDKLNMLDFCESVGIKKNKGNSSVKFKLSFYIDIKFELNIQWGSEYRAFEYFNHLINRRYSSHDLHTGQSVIQVMNHTSYDLNNRLFS